MYDSSSAGQTVKKYIINILMNGLLCMCVCVLYCDDDNTIPNVLYKMENAAASAMQFSIKELNNYDDYDSN